MRGRPCFRRRTGLRAGPAHLTLVSLRPTRNTAMREAAVFQTEAEFRAWFERNLTRFGFRRIILAQEPCPDYVLEKLDGTIVRAEAELFAVNFRYHRHDPAKVDLIIACYAKGPELDGIPVIAANELWAEEEEVLEPLSPEGELSDIEAVILSIVFGTGGIDISALALNSTEKRLAGDHNIFFRVPPETMGKLPRGKMADNLFTVVSEDARQFFKKYHHILIGSGLSTEACEALQSLPAVTPAAGPHKVSTNRNCSCSLRRSLCQTPRLGPHRSASHRRCTPLASGRHSEPDVPVRGRLPRA
jgi:hypothetical protein